MQTPGPFPPLQPPPSNGSRIPGLERAHCVILYLRPSSQSHPAHPLIQPEAEAQTKEINEATRQQGKSGSEERKKERKKERSPASATDLFVYSVDFFDSFPRQHLLIPEDREIFTRDNEVTLNR